MITDVRVTRLSNGVKVISSALPHVESVAFGIWVGVGGRYEEASMSGVSHFIEHMLFKGTKKLSAKGISQAIEGRGGYLNAFTQEESTCYYARVAYDQLHRAVGVLTDMYQNSVFDRGELAREKGVIVEEIMMYRDQPQQLVQELLGEALWKDHALGRPLIGSPETLQKMNRKNMLAFLKSKYVPGNTVCAFAGKLDHDRCVREVEGAMSGHRTGRRPRCSPVAASVGQKRVVFHEKEIEQTHLSMGVRLFGRKDDKRFALRVLSAALGENMSSRLFQIVREKHGLAYSIHSSIHLFQDSGAFIVSAGLDKKRVPKAIELIVKEMGRMKDRPMGNAEIRRAKDYVVGQIRMGWESTSHQMLWLGDNLLNRDRFVSPEEIIARLQKVTAEDVQKVARHVLRRSRLSLSLVYPKLQMNEQRKIREVLKGF